MRSLVWMKDAGAEYAEVDFAEGPAATGTAVTEGTGDIDGPPPGRFDDLDGALDCDLGLSPLTDSMPVLRHGLLKGGGRVAPTVAWVGMPHLQVIRRPQWYTHLDQGSVRHESEGFTADPSYDADGLVSDYPGPARAVR